MRTLKWAALLAIAIVVVAAIAHIRRDSIARGIANSFLSEQDLAVTELSVDALTTNHLDLSVLVIESASGARYELYGLSLPLLGADTDVERITADHLIVSYAASRDMQTMLSATLGTVLELPLKRPGIDASIGRITLPKLPELINARWQTSPDGQSLSLRVDAVDVAATSRRLEDETYHLVVRGTGARDEQVLRTDLNLLRSDDKYSANGQVMLSVLAWLPVLKQLQLVPPALTSLDAILQGPMEILLDEAAPGQAAVAANLALIDRLDAKYVSDGGQTTTLSVTSMSDLDVDFAYPSIEWTARTETAEGIITTDDVSNLPTVVKKLECRSGVHCTLVAVVDAPDVSWNDYTFGLVKLSLPLLLETGDVPRITVSTEATAQFSGVRSADLRADVVDIAKFSGTELIVEDDGWRCSIASLQLEIKDLEVTGQLLLSPSVLLQNFSIRDSARSVDAQITVLSAFTASWEDLAFSPPGLEGVFSLRQDKLNSVLKVTDHRDAVTGTISLQRDLSTGVGSLSLTDATALFDRASLSEYFPSWPYSWDIVRGTLLARANLKWQSGGEDVELGGALLFGFDSLDGMYNDIAFVDLTTEISAELTPAGIDAAPSSLAIRLLDVGVPVENISFDFAADVGKQVVDVESLSMDVLGGEMTADPFRYALMAETNDIMLRARSIQLQLMVDILEFESIEMTGAISGELPMTISGNNITIGSGDLQSEAPGGVIRYQSDDGALNAAVPDDSLNIVTRALSNFEFDSLTSDVDYTEAGDLKLQMRLSGINPDMDATQPIILNLGVENNVPQLLRSLQAIRSIEDILEQQTAN